MILSRTSEYALQALVHLAVQPTGQPVLNRDVARYLGVPAPYLTKILKGLVQRGLVQSHKGRGGGYAIQRAALDVTVREVVELVEGPSVFQECLLGLKVCADATACPVHHAWAPLKAGLLGLLDRRTVGSMADAVRAGKYQLVPPAGGAAPRRRRAGPAGKRRGHPKGT
ncbi:MAG: Rrf2 family transcriptional regulator [Gemmatimonadales bacterium]|jgi:Rrf2 family iron-sulfur cluster assembly transcriptional regulator|nr:Rrf2 family transcriptional regulator [Gemmatimonadales bacterium]MBP9199309.1 Rrf2 family transcriptional regulator [Gemmatimonadales bacterium]